MYIDTLFITSTQNHQYAEKTLSVQRLIFNAVLKSYL